MSDFELFWLGVGIYLAGVVTGIIIQIARALSRGKEAGIASPMESNDDDRGVGAAGGPERVLMSAGAGAWESATGASGRGKQFRATGR
jgi:hypothetical protein